MLYSKERRIARVCWTESDAIGWRESARSNDHLIHHPLVNRNRIFGRSSRSIKSRKENGSIFFIIELLYSNQLCRRVIFHLTFQLCWPKWFIAKIELAKDLAALDLFNISSRHYLFDLAYAIAFDFRCVLTFPPFFPYLLLTFQSIF